MNMAYLTGGDFSAYQAVAGAVFLVLAIRELFNADVRGTILMLLLFASAMIPIFGIPCLLFFIAAGGLTAEQ